MDIDQLETTEKVLGVHFAIMNSQLEIIKKKLTSTNIQNKPLPLHLTLLLMPVADQDFTVLQNLLIEYCEKIKKIEATTDTQITLALNGSYLLKFNSEQLIIIHQDLLNLTNKFREGRIRNKDRERIKENSNCFSEKEKEMLLKNGFIYSGDLFSAHIMLGKPEGNLSVEIISECNRNLPLKIILSDLEMMIHHEDVSNPQIYWEKKIKLE